MRALCHESETALLEAYLQEAKRFPLGVLAIGGEVVLMNRYLRTALDADDRPRCCSTRRTCSPGDGRRRAGGLPSGNAAKITAVERAGTRGGTNAVFHVHLAVMQSLTHWRFGSQARCWSGQAATNWAAC